MKPTRMNLLKSVFVFGISCMSLSCMAQSESDYAALTEIIPAEQLAELETAHPLRYQRLALMNRNAYHISNMGPKGSSEYPSVFEVEKNFDNMPEITLELIEAQELSILGYDFDFSPTEYTYYKLDDNGKVLSIVPLNILFKKANLEIE